MNNVHLQNMPIARRTELADSVSDDRIHFRDDEPLHFAGIINPELIQVAVNVGLEDW